jgi:hypothetical protein
MKPLILVSASLALVSGVPAFAGQPVAPAAAAPSSAQSAGPGFTTVIDGAKNPESLPRREVVWRFFLRVHAMERHQAGNGVVFLEKVVGLQPNQAQAVVAYVDTTLSQHRQFWKSEISSYCNGSVDTSDAKAMASLLSADENAADVWRDAKVAGLSTILDTATISRLDQWMDAHTRNRITVIKADYAKYLALPGALSDVTEKIATLCSSNPQ